MLYNRNFGKLNGQSLEYAPQNELYNGSWYIPASETILRKLGWKQIVDTPYPSDGKSYTMSWKETAKQIKKVWTRVPDPAPLTPSEQREKAYQEELICKYGNGIYTVDYMNKLWYEYSAEGNTEKVNEITEIIAAAKAEIREKYPDK